MLNVEVVVSESFDETEGVFIEDVFDLEIEHSLLSLSKWESLFEKPFLNVSDLSGEEFAAYVKMMTLTPNFPSEYYEKLTAANYTEIAEYIGSKQSATTITDISRPGTREIITSEVMYSWLVFNNIPFIPTEKWHLNRLLNLVRVCNMKNTTPKKMSRQEIARRNKELNDKRRAELGTKG